MVFLTHIISNQPWIHLYKRTVFSTTFSGECVFFFFFRHPLKINFSTNNKQRMLAVTAIASADADTTVVDIVVAVVFAIIMWFPISSRVPFVFQRYSVWNVCATFVSLFILFYFSSWFFAPCDFELLQRVRHANYKIFSLFSDCELREVWCSVCAFLFISFRFVQNWLLIRLFGFSVLWFRLFGLLFIQSFFSSLCTENIIAIIFVCLEYTYLAYSVLEWMNDCINVNI